MAEAEQWRPHTLGFYSKMEQHLGELAIQVAQARRKASQSFDHTEAIPSLHALVDSQAITQAVSGSSPTPPPPACPPPAEEPKVRWAV